MSSNYPATTYADGVELTMKSGNQLHEIINGTATEEITTDSGMVPSVRKAIADSMLFKQAIEWAQGSVETDPLQTRNFNGTLFWAPAATTANPIAMGASPVEDSNWSLAPVGRDTIAMNANLISNSHFEFAGTVTNPPDAVARNYDDGDEIFSGIYAKGAITNVTFVDGVLNGFGELYVDVVKNAKMKEATSGVISSIAGTNGEPYITGSSVADAGDYYRVTFSMNNTFSVKLEQGSVATGHEVKRFNDKYYANVLDYGAVFHKQGVARQEGTSIIQSASDSGKIVRIPRGVELRVDTTKIDISSCKGILGAGVIETYGVGSNVVPDDFFIKGVTITTKDSFDTYLRLRGTDNKDEDPSKWASRVIVKDCKLGTDFPDGEPQQYLCIDMGYMNNSTYTGNHVYRGSSWFRGIKGCSVTSNNIDADRAGLTNRDLDTGADCVKFTEGTYGTISGNVLENAGRDGIDAFSSGKLTSITGNLIKNFYTEGIEIKSSNSQASGTLAECLSICGNTIVEGGYDKSDDHAAIFIRNLRDSERIHDIDISGNVISKIGDNAGSGGNYRGILAKGVDSLVVSGNTITQISHPSQVNAGILISDVKSYSITNNVIDSDDRGITGGSLGSGVIGFNTIRTNQTTSETVDYGIYLSGNNVDFKIIGNVVDVNKRAFNNEGGSISKATFSGNTFRNKTGNTVYFGGINDTIYSGNTHETEGSSDIVFMTNDAKTGLTVTDNSFKGGRYGFNLRNSTGSIITGNRGDQLRLCIHEEGGDYNIVKDNIQSNSTNPWQTGQPNSIFKDNITIP